MRENRDDYKDFMYFYPRVLIINLFRYLSNEHRKMLFQISTDLANHLTPVYRLALFV